LARGTTEPGGKLPLFDRDGRKVASRIVEVCIAHGWAAPWIHNPIKPDWLVCRLTAKGYAAIRDEPPAADRPAEGAAGKGTANQLERRDSDILVGSSAGPGPWKRE
jgi:hypothetical protein